MQLLGKTWQGALTFAMQALKNLAHFHHQLCWSSGLSRKFNLKGQRCFEKPHIKMTSWHVVSHSFNFFLEFNWVFGEKCLVISLPCNYVYWNHLSMIFFTRAHDSRAGGVGLHFLSFFISL